jgi:NAD(P)-dependent dehydrogenase (short-subunit alcohol dehydrogenase family)
MADACEAAFGTLDVLVCNAGTSRVAALADLEDVDWQEQWELNVMAPLRSMLAIAPRMAEGGGGRIVNVASSSGRRPSSRNAAYSVTKAAQLALSRVFAEAYAPRGVIVNAVAPGPTRTPLWVGNGGLADQLAAHLGVTRDDVLRNRGESLPIGRMGEPEEVAAVVVVLCSQLASNVAGATWPVDGGAVSAYI